MNAIGRIRGLALLEGATLLGIVSTLLTWFVGRGQPCFVPPCVDIIICLPGLRRGFPLVWVTDVDWPGHRPCLGLVCPPIVELNVDWFGLAVDLLFWTFLSALLLTLIIYKPKSSSSHISISGGRLSKSRQIIVFRVLLGLGFVSNLILPFGVYHSYVEPYVIDYLWGYKSPVGWIGLVLGSLLLAYPRTPIARKLSVGLFMVLGGILLLASMVITPLVTYDLLNLWHGACIQAWDIDRSTMNLWPLFLAIASTVMGAKVRGKRLK